MRGRSHLAEGAQLASGLGAGLLGAGRALLLPASLRAFGLPLLVVGLLIHWVGMTLHHRLESRTGAASGWERALFWSCWMILVATGLWIAVAQLTNHS